MLVMMWLPRIPHLTQVTQSTNSDAEAAAASASLDVDTEGSCSAACDEIAEPSLAVARSTPNCNLALQRRG